MYNEENLRQEYTKCQDYQKVFASDEGQIVLYDLMKQCNFLQPTFIPGDSHSTAYNEGMRKMFLYVLYQLEMRPEKLLETIRVQKEQDNKTRGNIYADID